MADATIIRMADQAAHVIHIQINPMIVPIPGYTVDATMTKMADKAVDVIPIQRHLCVSQQA